MTSLSLVVRAVVIIHHKRHRLRNATQQILGFWMMALTCTMVSGWSRDAQCGEVWVLVVVVVVVLVLWLGVVVVHSFVVGMVWYGMVRGAYRPSKTRSNEYKFSDDDQHICK
ncbi:hypothetical protein F5890DRAFT_621459 [Lentinula detonsa]|uniref:Transmembrane protein n=1 Tax=Lentinula detonsa TaxID=2804962 RepID=A0AA38UXB2_9AGAR|nr:hypothetical protein F5890DRAFT_621459 [Lentinula detonsa]